MTTVAVTHGAEIFAPGSGTGTVYRVRSGYVRLYKVLPDGRSITLALLGPGEFFSQDDAEDGYASGVIAEALGDVALEMLERSGFEEALSSSPELALETIASQERQLTALHTLVEHLLARDTGVRLATTLLALATAFGKDERDGRVLIGLALTHQSLANMIGSNRVTVTRKLIEFQAEGIVVSEGRNALRVDIAALREIAEVV